VPASQPPPSSTRIPGKSSNSGLYLAGIVLLALLAVGLFVWKSKQSPSAVTPQSATIAATSAAPPPPPPPLYAPPPPPKLEEEPDAGADAGKQPLARGSGAALPPLGPCGCKVIVNPPPALSDRLRATAGSAQGCYNRALRTGEASGSLTVSVQVGPNGSVCGASIINDSVRSSEISSCVLNKFRGAQFPAPAGGCSNVNIPISFKIRQ
jgi:TonB family protein